MNRLVLLLFLTITGCMSTVTETSNNTYRIQTIEFPLSSKTDGFDYAKMEWMRRAKIICKDKKIIGKPQFKNSNSGVSVGHRKTTAEKKWIFAIGEITCT